MSGITNTATSDTLPRSEHASSNVHSEAQTRTETGNSTHQSHAKGGGQASIVPQKLQEKLPESIERAVPNAIHDTGDQGGLHRKQ